MVLVLVDGNLTVQDLAAKIGNLHLVESALRELEEGGFISPSFEAVSIWDDNKLQARNDQISALSQFSTFGPKTPTTEKVAGPGEVGRHSHSFDKPSPRPSPKAGGEKFLFEPDRPPEVLLRDGERRISVRKAITSGLLLIVVLLIGLGVFYPYDNLKPAIESAATQYLQTPVKIGHVGLSFSPMPLLNLEDIRLGEEADSRIETIHIASPHLLLGSGMRRIPSVTASGAALTANRLVAIFSTLGAVPASSENKLLIQQLRVDHSLVSIRDLALHDISGEILFKADGTVERSSFQAAEHSIRLEAAPSPQGILLNIEGLGWKPGGLPASFSSLQAKGLLQKDKLLIQNLDTVFLGGIVKGNWLLDWRSGLVMAGEATLSRLDCRMISAAFAPSLRLEGELGGTLRLRGGGNDWESLWHSVEAMLDADVARGILHGVDLGEVARRGTGSVVRSGATKFDRLRAKLTINSGRTMGRDVHLDVGMMTAAGEFVVNRDRVVDGSLTVGIKTSVSSWVVPVRISGVLPDLVASGTQ
ncbi:hypothetical protein [Dechloromonas sp. A34]|uniref:hypothetical protein n=1 Tax=Dechloromonas sp. A34 TaxID=447588 RepID=UPI0022497CA9|nr:hypothetical protein [Dechloromonas sp. A34]